MGKAIFFERYGVNIKIILLYTVCDSDHHGKSFQLQMYSQIEQLHQALELIFMKLLNFVVVHFPEKSIMGSLDWNKLMWEWYF